MPRWRGDYAFLIRSLIAKDFRIRYRNMSLGVLWSVVNPLVMMAVLTFVFTRIFTSSTQNYALFVIAGLIPFNFFANSLTAGTLSLLDNAQLIKRVPVPRELITITSVLANTPHLVIQLGIMFFLGLAFGVLPNIHWVWLPLLWLFEIAFVCGLALITAGLNVFVRDMRYVVESGTVVLWWLVPIIYPFSMIPPEFAPIYEYNPLAALVLASRVIILEAQAPPATLVFKLFVVSLATAIAGFLIFNRLKARFYTYL